MRLAVFSDIHGNLAALQACVADAKARGAGYFINLGDCASGPLYPRETVQFLMAQDWIHIGGNHERYLRAPSITEMGRSDAFAFAQLGSAEKEWLAALPHSLNLGKDIALIHGTAMHDDATLLESVAGNQTVIASSSEIQSRLGGITSGLVLCGHSHIPRVLRTASGQLIVNPGSVGLPAYSYGKPEVFVETGSVDASYAFIERKTSGWQAQLISVPYNHLAAALKAEKEGRADWACALRTGYAMRG